MIGQLLFHLLRIRLGAIHLVDGKHQASPRHASVIDGLHGLGHEPILSRHHNDCHVRKLRPARTHGRESLVPWGVYQRETTAVGQRQRVGPKVLGDTPLLSRRDIRLTNGIAQRGLTMIHVP